MAFAFRYEMEEGCTYCGNPASQIDHVHPRAAQAHEATSYTAGLKVPCCGECNRLAGARIFKSLSHKREWIHWKLRRKYRRQLALPHWTDAEKKELGPNLRANLEAALKFQWLLQQRVTFRCDGRCRRGDVEPLSKALMEDAEPDSRFRPESSGEWLTPSDMGYVNPLSDEFDSQP